VQTGSNSHLSHSRRFEGALASSCLAPTPDLSPYCGLKNKCCRVRWRASPLLPLAYKSRIAFHITRMGERPRSGRANRRNALHTLLYVALPLFVGTVSVFAQGAGGAVSTDVLKDLAPGGKLRAAINLGNSVLAQTDATGQPKGVTPDLARELGRRLGVPVEFITFDAAGKVFDAVKSGAWDIAFVAIEPVRAAEIEFTAPYVIIDGTTWCRRIHR
jgi:Bacterial extracellular solute-binding proteins, family 3